MLVRPQETCPLCPMITPGKPAKENPATSNGQSADTSSQCSPTWAHTPGAVRARWGSLARIGSPDAVCSPETTQELEPVPSPRATTTGTAASASCAACNACSSAGLAYPAAWSAASDVCSASGSGTAPGVGGGAATSAGRSLGRRTGVLAAASKAGKSSLTSPVSPSVLYASA